MSQCIITSVDNKVAVYFNDIISQAKVEITGLKKNKPIIKNYYNTDHFIIELDKDISGFVEVTIITGKETLSKKVFINTKKVKL